MEDDDYILLLSQHLKEYIQAREDEIALVLNYNDIIENMQAGKMSAILTLEDGRSIDYQFEKLQYYYDLGIRLVGLTWNHPNCLGFPNSTEPLIMEKGLTDFGKECIPLMNDLGMVIDVSHLSDGGFYDVAEISQRPFVASHSNARAITPHPRNLTDEMIKIIADQGGVIGLNFAPQFLQDEQGVEDSRVKDMVRHLEHIKDIGGCDVLALGTDFDGVEGQFEIKQPTDMSILFEALEQAGWSMDLIEKFAYQNVLATLREIM